MTASVPFGPKEDPSDVLRIWNLAGKLPPATIFVPPDPVQAVQEAEVTEFTSWLGSPTDYGRGGEGVGDDAQRIEAFVLGTALTEPASPGDGSGEVPAEEIGVRMQGFASVRAKGAIARDRRTVLGKDFIPEQDSAEQSFQIYASPPFVWSPEDVERLLARIQGTGEPWEEDD